MPTNFQMKLRTKISYKDFQGVLIMFQILPQTLESLICEPLYRRLRKDPPSWNQEMTNNIQTLKGMVKSFPCLGIPYPNTFMIVETDASNLGYMEGY